MALQHIGGHQIETVTPGELSKQFHDHLGGNRLERLVRMRYETLKLLKLPRISVVATATGFILANPVGSSPCGPESGYLWQLRRVLITSSAGPSDAAVVSGLYAGSDVSAQQASLIEQSGIALSHAYYPATKAAWIFPGEQLYATLTGATIGNVYMLTGIAIEVSFEQQGKIL